MTDTECFSFQITTFKTMVIIVKDYIQLFIICEYEMFFVQSANLLHSSIVTKFSQQYPWQRLSTRRDVSIVTDLTLSVYNFVFFFIYANCYGLLAW